MAEKVKVSREIAEALDVLLKQNTKNDVMKIYFDAINVSEARMIPKEALIIRNLEPMQLATFLLNGYEVEQTPEEILLHEYQEGLRIGAGHRTHANAIKFTLETLGIEIKGINE